MKNIFKIIFSKIELEKNYYSKGKALLSDNYYKIIGNKCVIENRKRPLRTEVINHLLSLNKKNSIYLEIGVRNPDHNFHLIKAKIKYSVDPGLEFEPNPVDFKITSDKFFEQLEKGEVLSSTIKFDVIFIDGLHLADQVDRDIKNSLRYIKEDGFIVLHDCNPPSEWHARENYKYWHTPAKHYWNGTTWKAFFKWRCYPEIQSCCIDSDWGVGILSKGQPIGDPIKNLNPFFEFKILEESRRESLNLIDFDKFKSLKLKKM